ncbi:MAG: hypothetical protein R2765_06145 [Ferruginibacter sp.]
MVLLIPFQYHYNKTIRHSGLPSSLKKKKRFGYIVPYKINRRVLEGDRLNVVPDALLTALKYRRGSFYKKTCIRTWLSFSNKPLPPIS